jgi:hypothetical protein
MKTWRRFSRVLTAAMLASGLAFGGASAAAQAAVPQYWGFALIQHASGPAATGHWAESVASPAPAATPVAAGREVVRFPRIGYSKAGVVHVTAILGQFAWCQAQGWRPSGGAELVTVQCYGKGGQPQFVHFTVSFSASTGRLPGGLRYAYLYHAPAGTITSFNSAGQPNTVTPAGPGAWQVRLRGSGPATPSGNIQLTAVNKTRPAVCDVAGATQTTAQQVIDVRCYGQLGAPLNTGWTLTYQRGQAITGAQPRYFAYTTDNKRTCPLVPAPAAVNFNSNGATNAIFCTLPSPTKWFVRLPAVGAKPNIVFVTGFASAARICNLNNYWLTSSGSVSVQDVVCYRVSGGLATAQWSLSFDTKS